MSARTRRGSAARPAAQPPPTPTAAELEAQALGRVRHAREGVDRAHGLLARAGHEVTLAEQRQDESLQAELDGDDPWAAEVTLQAAKALRDARGLVQTATARQERALGNRARADANLARVRREHAVELARGEEPALTDIREEISEAVARLNRILAKGSALESRYARLYPGLTDAVNRADAAAGRSRDPDRVRNEVRVPECPLDPGLIAKLATWTPRPWMLDPRYEPGTEPPALTAPLEDQGDRLLWLGDEGHERHVHPDAHSGEEQPVPSWPPSHVRTHEQLMSEELAALAKMT